MCDLQAFLQTERTSWWEIWRDRQRWKLPFTACQRSAARCNVWGISRLTTLPRHSTKNSRQLHLGNLLGRKASSRGFRELESTRRQVLRLLDARWKVLRVSEFLPGQKQNLRCPRAHSAFQQDRSAGVDSWSN